VQEGPPEEIYDNPESAFAATFLGDANILRGRAAAGGIELADGTRIAARAAQAGTLAGASLCAVRPERITILPQDATVPAGGNRLAGRVVRRVFAGNSSTYYVDSQGTTIKVLVQNAGQQRLKEGQDAVLAWSPDSTVLLGA
jgi:ABC-type Fe3+/spermidine/putrescine transport system ATPase subunit